MKTVLLNTWRQRDRMFVLLSFLGFGVWSVINPTPSMGGLPDGAEYATYAEFVFATLFLAYGTVRSSFLVYALGHVLLIIGLFTVAGVVYFTSESPICLLIFGYGCGIAVSLENTMRERRLVAEVTADLAERTQPDGISGLKGEDE